MTLFTFLGGAFIKLVLFSSFLYIFFLTDLIAGIRKEKEAGTLPPNVASGWKSYIGTTKMLYIKMLFFSSLLS